MQILSYIVGSIFILIWLTYLKIGRKLAIASIARGSGSIMPNTIFQLNILPIYISILLFLSGNILYLLLCLILFFISRLFIKTIFPLTFGLNALTGYLFFKTFGLEFQYYLVVAIIVGIIIGQIFCSIIFNYVTGRDIVNRNTP